jgi:hypothetical protein
MRLDRRAVWVIVACCLLVTPNRAPSQKKNKEMKKEKDVTTTQTMINSPGAIQAGRDVIINSKPEPRRLTQAELDRMVELLRPYRGEKLFLIMLGEQEANRFATQIGEIFRAAGWQVYLVHAVQESIAYNGQWQATHGLQLGVPDTKQLSPPAKAVYSSFEHTKSPVTVTDASHLSSFYATDSDSSLDGIILKVGLRPEGAKKL